MANLRFNATQAPENEASITPQNINALSVLSDLSVIGSWLIWINLVSVSKINPKWEPSPRRRVLVDGLILTYAITYWAMNNGHRSQLMHITSGGVYILGRGDARHEE